MVRKDFFEKMSFELTHKYMEVDPQIRIFHKEEVKKEKD